VTEVAEVAEEAAAVTNATHPLRKVGITDADRKARGSANEEYLS
jgi:hypothetical protein